MKRSFLALAAAFACSLAVAVPVATGHGGLAAPPGTPVTLYSQNGTDAGIGIVSQLFDSCYDAFDSRAADDFHVPNTWKVTEVDAVGRYFNGSGPANSVCVTFYKNKNGLPGKVVADNEFIEGRDDGTGTFSIRVPRTRLEPGTYWVSVAVFMNFFAGGEWGWESQTTTVGHPAAWENPGEGFGTACTTWGKEADCMPEGQGDHMFTLKGAAR